MNAQSTAVAELPKRSLLAEMAARYGMEPKAFADTLKATVVPANTSNEEFAAFLVVAREYNLNPLTKEIYAFPKRGGGIQPIVPIDGWTNIINSNPQLDGIEFDDHFGENGKITAITCRLWRKDRTKPIVVTEYMAECVRNTDTWKQWPHRMLRHKALIQCARYAFGLAGIVDPDEAERIGTDQSKMRDVTPLKPPAPPPPTPPAPPTAAPSIAPDDAVDDAKEAVGSTEITPEEAVADLDEQMAACADVATLDEVWISNEDDINQWPKVVRDQAAAAYETHMKRIKG